MVFAIRADHVDIFRRDVGFLVRFAQRALDRAFTVGGGTSWNAPCATFRAPHRAMLHDNVRHFAGLFASAGQQYTGSAVRAPMLAAAIAINPTITRLMHVFLGRKRFRDTGS